ncbi:hypothetical protein FA15DRAFT_703918 [Coprinopsis marcescibilis]|uniref:Uncharacterized protein n=1 Tax=Coprinopsis marcescibilis TaxID=230819 RepID=A0A5C3KX49_COPMA|nr:hypothetical protein FA15DRAFT_703918 [Coprinopsis marcescibilis]
MPALFYRRPRMLLYLSMFAILGSSVSLFFLFCLFFKGTPHQRYEYGTKVPWNADQYLTYDHPTSTVGAAKLRIYKRLWDMFINPIYLAVLSERVPLMVPFVPYHHISKEAGVVPFGEIFNLTHLRFELQIPFLEWSPEAYSPSKIEKIGCW